MRTAVTIVNFITPRGRRVTPRLVFGTLGRVTDKLPGGRVPALATIERWSELELVIAYDWAIRVHRRASPKSRLQLRPRPAFLCRWKLRGHPAAADVLGPTGGGRL